LNQPLINDVADFFHRKLVTLVAAIRTHESILQPLGIAGNPQSPTALRAFFIGAEIGGAATASAG